MFGLALAIVAILYGCGQNPDEQPEGDPAICVVFNVNRETYGDVTRADKSTWEEGDRIHLRFGDGSVITHGQAVYQDGAWRVKYYGPLTSGTSLPVAGVYINNPADESKPEISLNAHSVIYSDESGSYNFDGTTLTINLTIKPKTGRMRFQGEPGTEITVTGLTTYSSYKSTVNQYVTISTPITLSVESDGYTQYVYGSFTNTTTPNLIIETGNSWYMKSFPSSIFTKGDSGYITIPTLEDCKGWLYNEKQVIKVGDVSIPMMKVVGETGAVYYVSETEVTERQYCKIMGDSIVSPDYPVVVICDNAISYISKLSEQTGRKFRMITDMEWKWARKGGINSQNYTYCGSSTVGDVAWYANNSGSKVHPVKEKQPNELGLYDMAGNCEEFTLNSADPYEFMTYGGDYRTAGTSMSNTSSYGVRSYAWWQSNYKYAIRLCMEP